MMLSGTVERSGRSDPSLASSAALALMFVFG